jgi:hypothetical protein
VLRKQHSALLAAELLFPATVEHERENRTAEQNESRRGIERTRDLMEFRRVAATRTSDALFHGTDFVEQGSACPEQYDRRLAPSTFNLQPSTS